MPVKNANFVRFTDYELCTLCLYYYIVILIYNFNEMGYELKIHILFPGDINGVPSKFCRTTGLCHQ